jgi:hypothetical protein
LLYRLVLIRRIQLAHVFFELCQCLNEVWNYQILVEHNLNKTFFITQYLTEVYLQKFDGGYAFICLFSFNSWITISFWIKAWQRFNSLLSFILNYNCYIYNILNCISTPYEPIKCLNIYFTIIDRIGSFWKRRKYSICC